MSVAQANILCTLHLGIHQLLHYKHPMHNDNMMHSPHPIRLRRILNNSND